MTILLTNNFLLCELVSKLVIVVILLLKLVIKEIFSCSDRIFSRTATL